VIKLSLETIIQTIFTRRSIRKFKDAEVPNDLLEKVLEAGRWAPSGENAQPWRFIIVKEKRKREILGKIAANGSGRRFKAEYISGKMERRLSKFKSEETKKRVYRRLISGEVSAFLKDAPVLIVVISRRDVWDAPYDCSAATMNILLAAHSLGLGACWVVAPTADVRDELKVKELLRIPDEYTVYNVVALGYPDEQPKPRPRLPLNEIVFYEEFGRGWKTYE